MHRAGIPKGQGSSSLSLHTSPPPSIIMQAKQKLSESEALTRLEPKGPPLDPNVLRAAALSSVDPTHMQRVLYFVLKLASCLARGGCTYQLP